MATEKNSNDYREERKARLAKAAKKNSKKSHKVSIGKLSKKAKAVVTAVVAVVIVAAIVLAACANSGVFKRMKTIETVSGDQFSAVEYEFHYRDLHNYFYQSAKSYDEYYGAGAGLQQFGYDTTKLPEDQEYPGSDYTLEDGSTPTWKQFFEHIAVKRMQQIEVICDLAEKDTEFELDPAALEEAKTQIADMKTQLKESAAAQGGTPISFSKYLRLQYGDGMTTTLFEKIVEKQTLFSEYSAYLAEKKSDGYLTDTAVLEENYKAQKLFIDCVDYRVFALSPDTSAIAEDATDEEKTAATKQATEDAKKKAEAMFAKVKDDASFIALAEENALEAQKAAMDFSKSETTLRTFAQNSDDGTGNPTNADGLNKEAIDWLYSADRKVGDKKLFDINGVQYIVYVVKPVYRDDVTLPVDVRHILVQFDSEAEDKNADKEAKKKEAEALYTSITQADDKLAKFLELCETENDDTGSAANGGLYEYVAKGQMVKPFEDWSFDPARKEGDMGIVETDYGFHIMYFVQTHEYPTWKYTIADELANDEVSKMLEDSVASDAYAVAKDNAVVAKLNSSIYDSLLSTYYVGVESASVAE